MKISFTAARRLRVAIHVMAAVIASLLTIPLTILLVVLWFFPGFDFSVSEIFGSLHRSLIRLFSGHVLRPLTLYATSSSTAARHI